MSNEDGSEHVLFKIAIKIPLHQPVKMNVFDHRTIEITTLLIFISTIKIITNTVVLPSQIVLLKESAVDMNVNIVAYNDNVCDSNNNQDCLWL